MRFAERPGTDPTKRPIREIVGVDPRLNQRWSTRRAHINTRRGELAIQFQHDHGRPPTPVEALHLAQQATLETRDAKHEPRSLAEQRTTWLQRGRSRVGQLGGRRRDGADGADATRRDHHDRRRPLGRPDGRPHRGRDGGKPLDLADVACPGRSATTSPHHRRARRTGERRWSTCWSMRCSIAGRLPWPHRADGIEEPEALRRVDGSSVYTVAGADLYTSQRILDAETRLVAAAGRRDGSAVDQSAVDLALLEMAANGTALDAGQAALVRQMCTSGARLQLAIAPAGAGKTTAMRALTLAWTQDGGQVVGLAPSAAAAAVLAEQTGIRTDTLAKLTWSLQHGDLPDWAAAVGPSTLVIIDEAGMADTLTLDTAVQFAIERGASVRLIGDDQQLAAIGAGGVLRDINHTHGALRLTELHRFTDPAEAAASLALRDGNPTALDFYLDHGRVHVGDLATTTEDAFTAWVSDRAAGLDAIMLAPTRDLVAELNRRARAHRLDDVRSGIGGAVGRRQPGQRRRCDHHPQQRPPTPPHRHRLGQERRPLDHHPRQQARRPDRAAHPQPPHRPAARRLRARPRPVSATPPPSTPPKASTADTMHGLLTGQESRQQLYTMLTRGRHANHLYLQVVGDGDPHSLIRPDTISPRTPTETLQQILARDEAPVSASTLLRELNDPAARLFQAVQRYTDGLHVAAEQLLGPQTVAELDQADQYLPGLTTEPAWPTLRAHLLALAAETGQHPLRHMLTAAAGRDLRTAGDMAAVLYWRLPELAPADPGPLPWLPGIPETLRAHPVWGDLPGKAIPTGRRPRRPGPRPRLPR